MVEDRIQVSRSDISDAPEALRFTVPIRVETCWLVMLTVLIVGWACGYAGAFLMLACALLGGRDDRWFGVGLSVLHILIGPVVLALLYRQRRWYKYGKEIITVGRFWLTLGYELDGQVVSTQFQLSRLQNLRVSPKRHNPRVFWADFACGNIAFEYKNGSYRFGIGLPRSEAVAMLDRLRERFPGIS